MITKLQYNKITPLNILHHASAINISKALGIKK